MNWRLTNGKLKLKPRIVIRAKSRPRTLEPLENDTISSVSRKYSMILIKHGIAVVPNCPSQLKPTIGRPCSFKKQDWSLRLLR